MKEQYNKLYSKQSNAWRKRRMPFYRKLASYILPTDNVLDLGCGNGILAATSIWDKYFGIDYSEVAIQQAKRFCPKADFYCGDVLEYIRITNYNTVILTEFLEHIEEDTKILWKIKVGAKVILSVPDNEPLINGMPTNCRLHKRSYTIDNIKNRYHMIDFTELFIFEKWIIGVGIKK